jgi:hypothetical protein
MWYTVFLNWSPISGFADLSLISAQANEEFYFSQPVLFKCMFVCEMVRFRSNQTGKGCSVIKLWSTFCKVWWAQILSF